MIQILSYPRYERRGECNRCGYCCMNENCEHFIPASGSNPATCLIHDAPNRLDKCATYPEMPPIVFERCGFYFYDNWEKRKCGYREV